MSDIPIGFLLAAPGFRFFMQFCFKPLLPISGLMLLVAGLGHDAHAQNRASQSVRTSKSVAGELLVRWNTQRVPLVLAPGASMSRYQQSAVQAQIGAKAPGSRLKKSFAATGWSLISLPAGQSSAAARAALIQSLGASNVSLNYRRYATRTPNDFYFNSQWQWPKIKALDAWNTGVGTSNVVVAVLDTGIDLTHPDIQANLWRNPREIAGNRVDDDGNGYVDDVFGLDAVDSTTSPQDENGHGTHCAGLIGAVGNNERGATGTNWNVKIMALRFLDAQGSGSDADAIACFEYAIAMKRRGVNLKVISNSYAGPDDNPAFKAAYQAAESAGILQVCAAGNDGQNNDVAPQYPASYSTATNISVAATDQNDALAWFSNYGARGVDIAAPGVQIPSLRLVSGIVNESGTSMATPIVAGAAALVSSLEPGLSASALKARLMSTVDSISGLQGLVKSGGRLNLARAVLPVSYSLKGQAFRLDGTTRVPLASAAIALSGKATGTVFTPANGTYGFSNLAPGTYTLKATLSGYTFDTVTKTFPVAGGANSATVDFKATSAPKAFYTLFGTARNAAGAGVPGITVARYSMPNTVLATTDANGKYSIPNFPAGTYTLRATGSNLAWTTLPERITVPESAVNGRAEVNFKGVSIDKSAPAISIQTPVDGGNFAPGSQNATGTATDATGNKEIYFQLSRLVNFVPSYFDWTTRQWIGNTTAATLATRALTGKNANWSLALPPLSAANYSLRVWGRDTLDNVSQGEADAFASFNVVKTGASPAPSGGSS